MTSDVCLSFSPCATFTSLYSGYTVNNTVQYQSTCTTESSPPNSQILALLRTTNLFGKNEQTPHYFFRFSNNRQTWFPLAIISHVFLPSQAVLEHLMMYQQNRIVFYLFASFSAKSPDYRSVTTASPTITWNTLIKIFVWTTLRYSKQLVMRLSFNCLS